METQIFKQIYIFKREKTRLNWAVHIISNTSIISKNESQHHALLYYNVKTCTKDIEIWMVCAEYLSSNVLQAVSAEREKH